MADPDAVRWLVASLPQRRDGCSAAALPFFPDTTWEQIKHLGNSIEAAVLNLAGGPARG